MSVSQYAEILTYTSPFMLLLGTFIGAYYYKYLGSINKLILLYLVISLLIDLSSRIMADIASNNLILFIVLSISELLVFARIYFDLLKKRKMVLFMTLPGIVFMIIEMIYINSNDLALFQPYSKVITSFFIVIWVFLYFFERIKADDEVYVKDRFLNGMILFYFGLELIFVLPLNFLINNYNDYIFYFWIARVLILIIFYTCLIQFLWKNGKNQKLLRYG